MKASATPTLRHRLTGPDEAAKYRDLKTDLRRADERLPSESVRPWTEKNGIFVALDPGLAGGNSALQHAR
jgi:hypothetical protein